MKKCTLSRIKSFEERHIMPKKRLNSKESLIQTETIQVIEDNINYMNNNTDKGRVLRRKFNKKNLSNIISQLFSTSSLFSKIYNKSNNNINFEQGNSNLIKRYKSEKIRIMKNNVENIKKNFLVSTDNTTEDINISENDNLDEFNSNEHKFIFNNYISSFNMFHSSKYFGKPKTLKECDYIIKNTDNVENKNSTFKNIYTYKKFNEYKEAYNNMILTKNYYSMNHSKFINNQYKKLSFEKHHKSNILKKEIIRENSNCKNISSSLSFPIKKNSKDKIISIKNKKESSHYILTTHVSTPDEQKKINKKFERTETQNFKKNNNINNRTNLFISCFTESKKTKNFKKKINETYKKEIRNNKNSKKLNIRKLSMNYIINNNSKENKDINISHKFQYNQNLKNINNKEIKENNTSNKKINIISFNDNLKKITKNINNNLKSTKLITNKLNKDKVFGIQDSNRVVNFIYSNNNFNKNDEILNNFNIFKNNYGKIKKIDTLKNKKQITNSKLINYYNNFTNIKSNSDTNLLNIIKNNKYKIIFEKDKNFTKINKNFKNNKKNINKKEKFKEDINNDIIVQNVIMSYKYNKNDLPYKRLRNTIKANILYKAFKDFNIEKFLDIPSFINLSWINKKFYKKERILLFHYYYNKIIKEKNCVYYRIYLFKNIFSYSSKELQMIKSKLDIKKRYEYYSKKIKSNYKEEIIKDLSRTFPNDKYFNKNIKYKLYYLLTGYSNFNKKIGYAQGLNFVAASCLYLLPNEEEAFIFLDSFINKFELYNYLGIENEKLIQKIKYFDLLLFKYIPDLNEYLKSKLLGHEFFTTGWILSVFSNNMNKKKLFICWCFMIIFGWKFFYSFIIQVLIKYKKLIIDSEESILCNKMKNILNDSQFIQDFNKIIKDTLLFMVDNILL